MFDKRIELNIPPRNTRCLKCSLCYRYFEPGLFKNSSNGKPICEDCFQKIIINSLFLNNKN